MTVVLMNPTKPLFIREKTVSPMTSRIISLACVHSTTLLLATLPTFGVVVATGIPNTSAPVGMPYFHNVGTLTNAAGTSSASAVYLGNRWVLSANHVSPSLPGAGKVNFAGIAYDSTPGSWQRLANPTGMGLSVSTDLVLFQLASDPGLPALSIRSAAPSVAESVIMIGNGRIQSSSLTGWDVTVVAGPANDVWTEVSPASSGDLQGFKVSPSQQISWGANEVQSVGLTINLGTHGDILALSTRFDQGPGSFVQEGQAINGDSGGAVFTQTAGGWSLIGMMNAVNSYENQPYNTSIFGQSTFAADLSVYLGQIVTVTGIPEPSSLWFLAGATILMTFRSGRSRPNAAANR
jgi:hypothetical protein